MMVGLAKGCLNGRSWLHSSQIAGFRHNKLESPGPRTFVALERLNYFLHRYLTQKILIPGTTSSNAYVHGEAILEDGQPPPVGWWVEVFVGVRIPKDIDIRDDLFTDDKAADFSQRYGALIRRLLIAQSVDMITDLSKVVYHNYPTKETERVQKLLDIIYDKSTWNANELCLELPALTIFASHLGGPDNEAQLLQELRA